MALEAEWPHQAEELLLQDVEQKAELSLALKLF